MADWHAPTDFAAIRALVGRLPEPDTEAVARTAAREAQLTKPAGALGRLESLTAWLAGWQRRHPPRLDRVRVAVFAGWHGIAGRGVSAYPAEVTGQMVANFEAGGAAINQLCRVAGAELVVRAIAPGVPTAVLTEAPAMDEAACMAAFAEGWATAFADLDLLAVGEMGIGNTTAAAALAAALVGGDPAGWVGPGTGLDAAGVARKAAAVSAALAFHGGHLGDPLEALRRVGGREIAAMAGAILGARVARVPVLLDGYVATAAAAVLQRLDRTALDHVRAAHRSAEPAHGRLLAALGLDPLLDLGMRLGEASGAAVAIPILRAAVACHAGMATFAEAAVSGPA
ncbi:MAG: nicotinate-nucleotide--dimethylbenzimidazole phosphoribosyltransferase [Geminicoccaceae bacterium]